MLLLVLQTMTQLSAHLANQIHFLIHTQWYHDGRLHQDKSLCQMTSPLSAKYHTTHIRHTLMDTKFHHCGGTHCLGHSDFNEMCELWAIYSHSDFSIDKQPHSKKSHLQSVTLSPFRLALVIFHPLGCTQPMTTLHTPSIPPQGTHSLFFTRKDRYLVSISPVTNHSKITFHIQMYLSQQF